MELSIRMRRWRLALGVSMAKCAEAVGCGKPAISMQETGKANPTVENLRAYVVDGLGLSMSKFYDDKALLAAERRTRTAA